MQHCRGTEVRAARPKLRCHWKFDAALRVEAPEIVAAGLPDRRGRRQRLLLLPQERLLGHPGLPWSQSEELMLVLLLVVALCGKDCGIHWQSCPIS